MLTIEELLSNTNVQLLRLKSAEEFFKSQHDVPKLRLPQNSRSLVPFPFSKIKFSRTLVRVSNQKTITFAK